MGIDEAQVQVEQIEAAAGQEQRGGARAAIEPPCSVCPLLLSQRANDRGFF